MTSKGQEGLSIIFTECLWDYGLLKSHVKLRELLGEKLGIPHLSPPKPCPSSKFKKTSRTSEATSTSIPTKGKPTPSKEKLPAATGNAAPNYNKIMKWSPRYEATHEIVFFSLKKEIQDSLRCIIEYWEAVKEVKPELSDASAYEFLSNGLCFSDFSRVCACSAHRFFPCTKNNYFFRAYCFSNPPTQNLLLTWQP